MAITDYASLKTALAARAIRTDLTSLLPDFLRAAHDEIVNKVVVQAQLSLSAATASLPSDFRSVVAVVLDTYPAQILTLGDPQQMSVTSSGKPELYAWASSTLTVAPTPDQTYGARLLYKLSRTMFSADADTNTALTRYPFLYLNGAMAELMAHVRDDTREAEYRQKFEAGLDQVIQAELADMYGEATLQPTPSMVV